MTTLQCASCRTACSVHLLQRLVSRERGYVAIQAILSMSSSPLSMSDRLTPDPSVTQHSTARAPIAPLVRLQDVPLLDRDPPVQRFPTARATTGATHLQHTDNMPLPKRLKPNTHLLDQAHPPPDPLDADPFALMASQSHLLDSALLPHMQRGNSSSVRDLDSLPTPSIGDLEVGLPEAAGSSGKAEVRTDAHDQAQDKSTLEDPALQQQLQQLKHNFDAAKAQHRLQLQERNRQIGQLQEDRERLRRLLKKAEGDVRDAQDLVLCTVCQKNNRNCLILPCLHYLLCAGCLQQHTATCPFCPACKTKVSGLLVVLTSM